MPASTIRSYLYVPGNRPDRFDKACAAGADAVIVDLEDAVPAAEKADARMAVSQWLSAKQPVLVRINAMDTPWFSDDVELCSQPGVAGMILSKAEHVDDARLQARMSETRPVLPLIETARGFADALALARTKFVQRLIFGTIDFQIDLGIQGEGEELLYFRSQLVLMSRLAGIQSPVDGVVTAIDDVERIRSETQRARRLGFGAKLVIHPRQLAAIHAGFGPSDEDIAWAKRVLAAATASKGAAVAVDGKMVDRPVIQQAEEIIAESARRT
jgi:citrate lyase subunit beta/citryl-CoA lyase